jgi:hypothetical protein
MASIRAGRDESKGQTDIHGLTINLPKTVLKALVPAGVSEEMLTKLAGAAVDVVSLPGKSALSSFTGGEDSGVGMMGEFAATMNAMLHGTTGTGEQDMDSGWKAASRTAVMTVKTYEHLATMERMVREMKDKVLDSFDQSMRQILEPLGWTEAVTNYFLHNGRYPNLVRASYSLYESFFTELLRLYQSYNSFEPVKKVLDHYSEQFRLNRWTAISRFGLILSNYITLREGFTDKFRPAKVERVLNDYFRQTLLLKGGSGKTSFVLPRWKGSLTTTSGRPFSSRAVVERRQRRPRRRQRLPPQIRTRRRGAPAVALPFMREEPPDALLVTQQ